MVTSSRFRCPRWLVVSLALAGCLVWGGELFSADTDWPQWRGMERTAVMPVDAKFPQRLSGPEGVELVWESELGPSYSGPVVSGTTLVTTETVDASSERVTAFNLENGEKLWTQQWQGAMSVPFFAKKNGDWIRATPAIAAGKVYVAGMCDLLVCLDLKSGQEIWKCDFKERFQTALPAFGFVSSPLVDDGAVYVQAGGALCKLDAESGETIWRTLGGEDGMDSAFASPVIATLCGKRQLVVQTRSDLCGVELATGKVLWNQTIEAFRGMNILTPTVVGDRIFTSAYGGRSNLWEVTCDADGNWQIEPLWDEKHQAYMSSPVLINDHLYLHLRNTRFTCLKLEDGTATWVTKPVGDYWSLIACDTKILALSSDGVLRLIEANPSEYQELDSLTVAKDSWAHLAIAGNKLIVRHLAGIKVFAF